VSDFNLPQGLLQGAASQQGLGQYATSLLNPLAAMTNWASGLATGGAAKGIPSTQAEMTQAGPATIFSKAPNQKPWASQFDPTTGLITFTNPGNPRQTFQATIQSAQQQGADLPPEVLNQWKSAHQQYLASQKGGGAGTSGDLSKAGPLISGAYSDIQQQQAATGMMSDLMRQAGGFVTSAQEQAAKMAGLGDVTQAQVKGLEDKAQQLYGVGYNELSAADKQVVQANALVGMTTTGEGLFPAQKAMIEQARQSEETQLASTLGTAGLGRSTQLNQLQGAADLAAAATAGQLQQGNIEAAEKVLSGALGEQAGAQKTIAAAQAQTQAAQNYYSLQQGAQKLALSGQALEADEQKQLVAELGDISKQSLAMQQQLWKQAMDGYGLMGQIIDSASKSYGYSLDAYKSVLGAQEQHTQTEAGLQEKQMAADQSSNNTLFDGLGTLFGSSGIFSSGGAGGGLFGGLLGGAAGGAAAAGAGGAVDAAGMAVVAVFAA
jgi:hypothetical protein